jgi:hypothetical protein
MSPFDIEIELRIYQRDEVLIEIGNPEAVLHIMDKIVHFDMQIELFKERSGA